MNWKLLLGRRQRRSLGLLLLLLSLCSYIGQQQGWFSSAKQVAEINQPGLYKVTEYVDGDTIKVDMNGTTETLRFIGVDTPETHKPNTPVQCFGPEAAAFTKQLIASAGGRVRLASDPYSTNRDRYGRLLRYIYVPDGRLVEAELIRSGHGFYYPYFPFSKASQFKADEQQAISTKQGLWAHCTPTPSDDGGYKMDELAT